MTTTTITTSSDYYYEALDKEIHLTLQITDLHSVQGVFAVCSLKAFLPGRSIPILDIPNAYQLIASPLLANESEVIAAWNTIRAAFAEGPFSIGWDYIVLRYKDQIETVTKRLFCID